KGKKPRNPWAYTLYGRHGFSADVLHRLLFHQHIIPAVMQEPDPTWMGDLWFIASAMNHNGQTTYGYPQVVLPIPGAVRRTLFGNATAAQSWGLLSQSMIDAAHDMHQILKNAFRATARKDSPIMQYLSTLLSRYTQQWNAAFFDHLWQSDPGNPEFALTSWATKLFGWAQTALAQARQSIPLGPATRYRVIAHAEHAFFQQLHSKKFAALAERLAIAGVLNNTALSDEERVTSHG
ncbi:MAG: hypothetical protein ACYCOU_25860, partial [Sulfobacillus sp.]